MCVCVCVWGGVLGVGIGWRLVGCVWCHFAGPSALTWNTALPLHWSYQVSEEIPDTGKHDPSAIRPAPTLAWMLFFMHH